MQQRDGNSTKRLLRFRKQAMLLITRACGGASGGQTPGIMMAPPAPGATTATAAAFLHGSSFIPLRQERSRSRHRRSLHQAGSSSTPRTSRPFLASSHDHDDSGHHSATRRTSPVRPLPSTATTTTTTTSTTGAAGALFRAPTGEAGLCTAGKISSSGATTVATGRLPPAPQQQTVGQQVQLRQQEARRRYAQAIRGGPSTAHAERQPQPTPDDDNNSNNADLGDSSNNPQVVHSTSTPVVAAAAATAAAATAAAAGPPATTTTTSLRRPAPVRPPADLAKLPRYLELLLDRGDWRKAVSVFEQAREHEAARRRVALSRGAYNLALSAYAKGRDGQSALELVRRMREAGGRLAPTRGSFNACLDACRHGRQRDKVMDVMEMMVEDGVPPSGKSYSSALQACAKDSNVADARKMLGWMWTSPDLEGGVKGLRPTTWGYNCAMEACARSGDWTSALELMGEMTSHGLAHNAFTYGAALEACGRTGNWEKAEAVVEQMAAAYADSLEPLDGSSSSSTSSGGGAVAAAENPERPVLAPTTVHCNALLQAYSRGKRVDKALRLLDQMLAATTPSATAGRLAAGSPPAAAAAAGQPDTTPAPDVSDANTTATPAPGGGGGGGDESGGALPLWDPRLPLSRPDAISFGTVIDGCSRARLADEAVQLLTKMRKERIGGRASIARVEEGTTAALGGSENGGGSGRGSGTGSGSDGSSGSGSGSGGGFVLRPNVHCVTAAITACGRAGRPGQAVAVLEEALALEDAWLAQLAQQQRLGERGGEAGAVGAPAIGEGTSATILRGAGPAAERSTAATAATATAAASAAFSGKPGKENAAVTGTRSVEAAPAAAAAAAAAATTLQPSPPAGGATRGITPAATGAGTAWVSGTLRPAYNAAINACLGSGRSSQARALMRSMRDRGLRPGREIFNSLLVACSDSAEALDLLAEMEVARVDPDVASYTAAIGACSRGGNLPAALELFGMMGGTPAAASAGAGGATGAGASVSAGAGAGGGGAGRGERMRQGAPRADAQAYGAAAAACARGLDHKAAVRLLGGMREAGLRPGRPMYGAVIDACARRGKWEEAVALLEEMTEAGVAPALRHYSSAIFACSLGENPGKGLELLSKMRRKRVRPNSTCVNAAIHGFTLVGDWETAVDVLESMERVYQVVPDSVSYNTAMKACFRVGRSQEGLALFARMRSYPPDPPRGGGGKRAPSSSSSSFRALPRPPFLKVSLRDGGEALPAAERDTGGVAAAAAVAAAAVTGDRDHRAGAAVAVPAPRGKLQGPAPAGAAGAGAGRGKTKGVGKKKGVGGGGGGGGGGVFRASSPPRPDTASYNTVIAAVASSWGWEGREQAMALVDEMRARGLKPDSFTALAAEKAGGEVEL